MTLYSFYCIRNRYKPPLSQYCALQIPMRYCWFSICASHSFIASFQSVTSPLAMASASWRAWSRALSRARFAFISAMVCSSRITIAPRRIASCSSSSPKALPARSKEIRVVEQSEKKKPRKPKICVAFAIILYANSALSLFYLSFYRNKYQKSDLVLHRAKCCEYFSVSSNA